MNKVSKLRDRLVRQERKLAELEQGAPCSSRARPAPRSKSKRPELRRPTPSSQPKNYGY